LWNEMEQKDLAESGLPFCYKASQFRFKKNEPNY